MEFVVKPPTKKLKEICKSLGSKYSIKVFDLDQVIYRDFGNEYEVEVRGLNHDEPDFSNARICVWHFERIVKEIKHIESLETLSETLAKLEADILS